MTNDNQFSISRRKVLAGLGTIGVASAGAGLGTTAFFSDTESLSGWLQAGRVDLLVDYRTTYKPWLDLSDEDERNRVIGDMMTRNALPLPEEPMTYVIGQAPDVRVDGNGSDGGVLSREQWGELFRSEAFNGDVCADGFQAGDLPGDVRLRGADENNLGKTDFIDGDEDAVFVDLIDIKPKDEGETTFSLHLCGNPSYLDMRPILDASLDNGTFEPELSAGDTDADDIGELADYLHVSLFADTNCDNLKNQGLAEFTEIDVVITIDESGSIDNTELSMIRDAAKSLVDELGNDDQSAAVAFADNATVRQSLTTDKDAVKTAIDAPRTTGGTNMTDAINTAQNELDTNGRMGAAPIIVLLSDGVPNNETTAREAADDAKTAGTRIFTIGFGVSASGRENLQRIAGTTANSTTTVDDEGDYFEAPTSDDLMDVFAELADIIAEGELCLYEGSLAGLLELAEENGGSIPLAAATLEENCVLPEARECFEAGAYCFALKWELPCELEDFEALTSCRVSDQDGFGSMADELLARGVVGSKDDIDVNITQTDSVHFSVAFDAEQCRHNTKVTTKTADGWAKIEEIFNGNEQPSTSAHARRDNPLGNQALELRGPTDNVLAGPVSHAWNLAGVPAAFSYEHDGSSNATFSIGGDSVSGAVAAPAAGGRLALQTKANESTMEVTNVKVEVNGMPINLDGPTAVTASDDDDTSARDLEYLLINTSALDLSNGFKVTGDIAITDAGSSAVEDFAFDVVVE